MQAILFPAKRNLEDETDSDWCPNPLILKYNVTLTSSQSVCAYMMFKHSSQTWLWQLACTYSKDEESLFSLSSYMGSPDKSSNLRSASPSTHSG